MTEQDDDLLGLNPQPDADAIENDEPVTDAAQDAGDADGEDDIPEGYIPPGVVAKIRGGYKTQLSKKDAELKALQDQLAKFQQPQQPQQEQAELTPEMQTRSAQLDTFEEIARMQVGDEVVDEFQNWFKGIARTNPYLAQAIQNSRNPYKTGMQHFHDALLLEELQELQAEHGFDPADPDGWVVNRYRALAEERRASPQQPSQQQPPPRSLAAHPNSGGAIGSVRTGPGAAFDDIF